MSGNDRYHTYQGHHAWWQGPSSLFPNPRPGYTTLGAHLLPVYWHQQTEKTRHTELKQGYHQATQQAHARFLAHSFTHTETLAQQQQWIDWAIWMCASSSALPLLSKDAMAIYLVSIILIGLHGTNLEGVDSHS